MQHLLKSHYSRNRSGFTLVELLVVIAILGLLASIAVPMYLGQRTKAAMQEARSNLQQLRLLQEQYYAEHGRYAPDIDNKVYKYLATHNNRADGGLEDVLRGFKPGELDALNFDYEMYSHTTTYAGDSFLLTATGKANTNVSGVKLTLNHNNEWGS